MLATIDQKMKTRRKMGVNRIDTRVARLQRPCYATMQRVGSMIGSDLPTGGSVSGTAAMQAEMRGRETFCFFFYFVISHAENRNVGEIALIA